VSETLEEKLAYWRERGAAFGHDRGHLTSTKVVVNELTGRPGGTQTYHRDGRVDAHVTPQSIHVGARSGQ
jgi:hypothetical protein